MKRIILFVLVITMIPCFFTVIFSFLFDEMRIGIGGNLLKNKYMGKEVLIEMNGLYKSMDVEEYVLGVLAGSISPDYDIETLKVQAVLIRTNILKEMQEKRTENAEDLSYHYLTKEERMKIWGSRKYETYERKMKKAVIQTAGKVIQQENHLIMALYHEVSIGKTASAKEILEKDISYLQEVESGKDVEAKNYMNMVHYTWREVNHILMESTLSESQMKTDNKTQNKEIEIKIEESTENGFVKKIVVDNKIISGEEAMNQFQLSSTNFYVENVNDGIRFVCLGKGNCLGVSQYGANRMALEGKKMKEIISYYYQNVSIEDYQN